GSTVRSGCSRRTSTPSRASRTGMEPGRPSPLPGHAMPETPFIVTIDTEGDDLWSAPRRISTRNAACLPRFQALCERYGYRPVYLVNYEMAQCAQFGEFGRDVLARAAGEIGMHPHAWNSPPMVALTADDYRYRPYLTEYPEHVMRDKIRFMTGLLEQRFGRKM